MEDKYHSIVLKHIFTKIAHKWKFHYRKLIKFKSILSFYIEVWVNWLSFKI